MKEQIKKVFCPAPFLHTYTSMGNSAFKLCCMSDIMDRIDTPAIRKGDTVANQQEKWWTSDKIKIVREAFLKNEWPVLEDGSHPCNYCKHYEEIGAERESARIDFINRYAPEGITMDNMGFNVETGNIYDHPIDIDLRPGKLCNATCRSCSSIWSSKIEKEVLDNYDLLEGTYWDMWTDNPWQMKMAESIDWDQDNSRLYDNYNLEGVRWLKMSGGETFIDPSCIKIWKQLVEHGDAKNINLHLITNGTVWPKKVIDLLSQFKGLQLRFSVDGLGKVFEYCRTGCEWKRVHTNFLKACELPNINSIGFNSVINVYNIFHIYNHVAWMIEQSRRFEFIDPPALHPIVEPMHLNIHWLDDDHKDFIRSEIERVIYDYNINEEEQECFQQVYSDLNKDVSHYRKDSKFADKLPDDLETRSDRWMLPNIKYNKEQFIKHTRLADKLRKTNILEITPQLERYLM